MSLSKHVTYQLGAVDAVAVLRFRCLTIKYTGTIHDASLYSGDASALVDIFRFLCTNFSQPIAAALRAHGYYPPPRWPKDPAMRDQMIVAHMYSGMRAICPSWTPSLSAPEFIRARDLVAVRVTLVLDVIKRLVAIHNRVVSANKANMRAAQARAKQGPPPIAAVDPIAEEDDLQVRNETDESGSNTSRASSGLAPPAESELNARKPASRWIATEFFNDDELALYRDQLQRLFPTQGLALDALGDGSSHERRGRMPSFDSELLGLTDLRALASPAVSSRAGADAPPEFEQIFSFQESTRGAK